MPTQKKDDAPKRHFRNLLIQPRYQLKVLGLTVIAGTLLSGLNYYLFYKYVRGHFELVSRILPLYPNTQQELFQQLNTSLWLMAFVALMLLLFILFLGLYVSHQSAGPIYRFKKVFDEIADGRRDLRISLRKNDDFQDVARSFNRMMDRLQG